MKIFYAQSGGVTAVINATLASLVQAARTKDLQVCLGLHGIKGLLNEQWVDSATLSESDLAKIALTPGGSFGSCRYSIREDEAAIICDKLAAHGFDALIYQGGNDSQLTLLKISQELRRRHCPTICLGIPKTIDNDLPITAFCPGFPSSAEFLIRGFRGACLDLQSMCQDSTKVFIVETMGRHTGWLTAACGLSHTELFPGPNLLLVPEVRHPLEEILEEVAQQVKQEQFCAIALSEGYAPTSGTSTDSFGHAQLEGSGLFLKKNIEKHLKLKTRLCVPDYFQRSFFSTANTLDTEISALLGTKAIDYLTEQQPSGHMLTIAPPAAQGNKAWEISSCPLAAVAGQERPLPRDFLDEKGWCLSRAGRGYFSQLLDESLSSDRNLVGLQHLWPHYLRQQWIANR